MFSLMNWKSSNNCEISILRKIWWPNWKFGFSKFHSIKNFFNHNTVKSQILRISILRWKVCWPNLKLIKYCVSILRLISILHLLLTNNIVKSRFDFIYPTYKGLSSRCPYSTHPWHTPHAHHNPHPFHTLPRSNASHSTLDDTRTTRLHSDRASDIGRRRIWIGKGRLGNRGRRRSGRSDMCRVGRSWCRTGLQKKKCIGEMVWKKNIYENSDRQFFKSIFIVTGEEWEN